MKKSTIAITLITASLLLASCNLVRPRQVPVQQGNIITQSIVNQLKPGMSKKEVTDIMGSPVLINTFDSDRFDYVYTLQQDYKPEVQKRLLLQFKDDKLSNIDGDYYPQTSSVQNAMADKTLQETTAKQAVNDSAPTTATQGNTP